MVKIALFAILLLLAGCASERPDGEGPLGGGASVEDLVLEEIMREKNLTDSALMEVVIESIRHYGSGDAMRVKTYTNYSNGRLVEEREYVMVGGTLVLLSYSGYFETGDGLSTEDILNGPNATR